MKSLGTGMELLIIMVGMVIFESSRFGCDVFQLRVDVCSLVHVFQQQPSLHVAI